MTKRDSSIANTTVTKGTAKGTDGVEWLRLLADTGEAARRPDGNLGRPEEPDRNHDVVPLSAAAAKQPTKRRAATAASAARSSAAKTGKFFSARRES